MPWNASLPTDPEILVHIFACFFDVLLPPPVGSANKASGAAGGACASTGSSLFGGGLGGGSNPFGGGLALGTAAAAAPSKGGVFWRAADELCGFSSRHLAKATDEQRRRSDAVLLQHGTSADSAELGSSKHSPPRYSLLCDGAEWVVAQGEHNVWDALVLFLVHRAKSGAQLGGVDLRQELYSPFLTAMRPDGALNIPAAASPIAYHGLLSTLHPWSQQLEDVELDEVARKF